MQLYPIRIKMVKSINLYNGFNIKNEHKSSIILIGNFDGIHLGHQKLFNLAKKYKKKIFFKDWSLDFWTSAKDVF